MNSATIKKRLTPELLRTAAHEAETAGYEESVEKYGVGHHCGPDWDRARKVVLDALFRRRKVCRVGGQT